MKFLAMHITNQKFSFDIFTVGNLQNIFLEHDLYLISQWFLAKMKKPLLLSTGFVVQGHICFSTV